MKKAIFILVFSLLNVFAWGKNFSHFSYKPVKTAPQEKDERTLFLATFNNSLKTADFAVGNPEISSAGTKKENGHYGNAVMITKDNLKISAKGNINLKAGTIELVVKNIDPRKRPRLFQGGPFSASISNGLWLYCNYNKKNAWVHEVEIARDFKDSWMRIVLGWDTDKKKMTAVIYTMKGRLYNNNIRYRSSVPLSDDAVKKILSATFADINIGFPGLIIDNIRISDVYRKNLLDPEKDYGPVEQYPNYSNAKKLFDKKTLLKSWTVGKYKFPQVTAAMIDTMKPVRRNKFGKVIKVIERDVPVIQCKKNNPVIKLDFGKLNISCYVVRVIAAVKTADLEKYRKPLYVDLKVNDQPGGKVSLYKQRVPYWDDFFAVAEIYFNVDEKRNYTATLTVGDGSIVDLYIHSIELHDVLKGLPGVAAKKKPGLFTFREREILRKDVKADEIYKKVAKNVSFDRKLYSGQTLLSPEERKKRDDLLWNAFPPINSQFTAEYDEGFVRKEMDPAKKLLEETAAKYGVWQLPRRHKSSLKGWYKPLTFNNKKLGLTYSRDDLKNHRWLPNPYPLKSCGAGAYIPKTGNMAHAVQFFPLAGRLGGRWKACWSPIAGWHGGNGRIPYLYHALDNKVAARDAALLLCKWAYIYPTHTDAQTLGYATIAPASRYHRDMRLLYRALMFYWGSPRGANLQNSLAIAYDYLFDYIKGNDELAKSVHKYIPWVKTEADVRRLIETRILQFGARQTIYYHLVTSKNHSVYLLRNILVQQDPEITRPWLESLWKKTHIYPHPDAGLPDYISTTTQRDGSTDIGSIFYTHAGSPFLKTVEMTHRYAQTNNISDFDLSNFKLYRKMADACLFPLETSIAGGFPMTIGDCGLPAEPRFIKNLRSFDLNFRMGWRCLKDKRCAWIIKRYLGRKYETDEEWLKIEKAAEIQKRNPFLSQKSRVLPNWAGILESGDDIDDYRFKRTAYLRVGTGHGHSHYDTLDLQIMGFGTCLLNDLGYRGAYTLPTSKRTRVHNRVEVNGKHHPREGDWEGYSWIDTFKPLSEVKYMSAEAIPPYHQKNVKLYRRSIALIDVDPGKFPKKSFKGLYQGAETKHDKNIVLPKFYVFDVQRISGGTWQTFNFHGCYSDDFHVNIKNKKDVGQQSHHKTKRDESVDGRYLLKFLDGPGLKYSGDVDDTGTVQATWRLRRAVDTIEGTIPHKGVKRICHQQNAEKTFLGVDYDENAPRKFIRLHLPDRKGEKILVGYPAPIGPRHDETTWPFLMVQNRNEKTEDAVYASIIEPYVEKPFIKKVETITIPDNEKDALKAVALRVIMNEREDICFSDGREKLRSVDNIKINSAFAFISKVKRKLNLLEMVRGKQLRINGMEIAPETPEYKGEIVKVDYLNRIIQVKGDIPPEVLLNSQIEIGNKDHKTSYGVINAHKQNNLVIITLDKAIDLSYATILSVDPVKKQIITNIGPTDVFNGMRKGLTCSNEGISKTYTCGIIGGGEAKSGCVYHLNDDFSEKDFPKGAKFRLWEFGVGDEISLPTHFQMKASNPDNKEYSVRTDCDTTISLKNGNIKYKDAAGSWKILPKQDKNGKSYFVLKTDMLTNKAVSLRFENRKH